MQKGINSYTLKSANFEIKDMDDEQRKVAIYLAKFDVMDSDRDVIKKGAFKKSIQERGPKSSSNRKIAFLRYHDWEKQIGKFESLQEDDNGLFAIAQLGSSQLGEDAWQDYKDGIIREHSIGFRYIADKMKLIESEKEEDNYWQINEVALWEGSAVTFGANPYTEVVDVMKSNEDNSYESVRKLYNEIEIMSKSLSQGRGSDDRLYKIEMKLKYLNSRMFELATLEPTNTHSKQEPQKTEVKNSFDWNKFILN